MVTQLERPERYSVCSEMHQVWAVNMRFDSKATPSMVNSTFCKFKISSRCLFFIRCLVVLHGHSGAILSSLTNNSHQLNDEMARRRVNLSGLPSENSFPCASSSIHMGSILMSTSCDLHNSMPPVPKHTITYTTLPFVFLPHQLHAPVL